MLEQLLLFPPHERRHACNVISATSFRHGVLRLFSFPLDLHSDVGVQCGVMHWWRSCAGSLPPPSRADGSWDEG